MINQAWAAATHRVRRKPHTIIAVASGLLNHVAIVAITALKF